MDLSKKIFLERLEHRGKKCISIRFNIDDELKRQVRLVQGATFSITHKCWYVVNRKCLLSDILAAFKGIAWVDMSALKTKIKETADSPASTSLQHLRAIVPVSKNSTHTKSSRMMEEKLKLKGYSENTIRTYLQQFKEFLQFYPDSDPYSLNESDVRNYLLYLVDRRKISRSAQNQAINAIKFFYEKVLEHERRVYYLERPLKEKRLPEVLNQGEVVQIFEA